MYLKPCHRFPGCWEKKKITTNVWLKTIELYSFTVLEARSPKSVWLGPNQGVSKAKLPREALGGDLPLTSYLELPAFLP